MPVSMKALISASLQHIRQVIFFFFLLSFCLSEKGTGAATLLSDYDGKPAIEVY